jgi:CDP-glucose 4,6-dehydratase
VHYLVTGHTGFKGAWLVQLLVEGGHEVSGLALDPLPGALFDSADLGPLLRHDVRQDIRDAAAVQAALDRIAPDVVVHLAAQPLVRLSYADPRTTIQTNVMGTLNMLEAVSRTPSVQAHLVITTDKVYRNVNQAAGYVEDDPLGGHDPYSASKAMADLLTQSWTASFPGPPTAIARAGNVVGGGDVSPDRLLPDLVSGFAAGRPVALRYPDAVRPWQHVLDCLGGYLDLVDALLAGTGSGEWNLGPGPEAFVTVGTVADLAARLWGDGATVVHEPGDHPHEASLLALDATKARTALGWSDRLPYPTSIEWTLAWEQRHRVGGEPARDLCREQIQAYRARA